MSAVVPFPQPETYWESCPVCHQVDEFLNIYRDHWFVCHRHRTKWWVGSNLFSTWRNEKPSDWTRNAARLSAYREVEPYQPAKQEPPADETDALRHEIGRREELLHDPDVDRSSLERELQVLRRRVCELEQEGSR